MAKDSARVKQCLPVVTVRHLLILNIYQLQSFESWLRESESCWGHTRSAHTWESSLSELLSACKTDQPGVRARNVSLRIYRCYPFSLSQICDNTRATQMGKHPSETLYETGKMVQSLRRSTHIVWRLTSITQNPYKKPTIMAHSYNPRAVKAGTSRPPGLTDQ